MEQLPDDLDAFFGALPQGEYDPLQSTETDYFWGSIEPCFSPITIENAEFLRDLDAYAGADDPSLCINLLGEEPEDKGARKRKKKELVVENENDVTLHLNSFPYTHRVVASLLEEGQGGTANGSAKVKNGLPEDIPWFGVGEEHALQKYQRILEERIIFELREAGLIEGENEDELLKKMREEQWILRGVKMCNSVRRNRLYSIISGKQLKTQARKRERKIVEDALQVSYLDRMSKSSKYNKRMRTKFVKLKNTMFPDHKAGNRTGNWNGKFTGAKGTGSKGSASKAVGSKASSDRRKKRRSSAKGNPNRKSKMVKEEVELTTLQSPDLESLVDEETMSAPAMEKNMKKEEAKEDLQTEPKKESSKAHQMDSSEEKLLKDFVKESLEESRKHSPRQPQAVTGASEAANTAQTVAEIIEDAGGEASKDHIITEYARRKSLSSEDATTSKARRQVTSALSFSLRPYRFKKVGNTDKYTLINVNRGS